ncbi:MAG TPA: succinate dehydrogenase [Pirellulaceae bacterium]|nr:succinate dehydrogenase [Pirellulaceae bacterium]
MAQPSFFVRHDFLIRRLHSLAGLVPVGVYVVVHLVTNSLILNSVAAFQGQVYTIHSLGPALWIVEWAFIFIPLLFHAILGVWLAFEGRPNATRYGFVNNWRYVLQRVTGMIAFFFIFAHVFHMHGWFHTELWHDYVSGPLGGATFKPYNAGSTAALSLQGNPVIPALYAIGVIATVFHLFNGIWTMGITWGAWTTPAAQRKANWVCLIGGLLLGVVGLTAIYGFVTLDVENAKQVEDTMYESRLSDLSAPESPEKRTQPDPVIDPASPEDAEARDDTHSGMRMAE